MKILLHPAYSFYQQGKRDYQEDCRYPDADSIGEKQRYFLVCDGVGGSEKGEVASQTVCMAFSKALRNTDFTDVFSVDSFGKVLDSAYDALDQVASHGGSMDMGTTLTFICFHAEGCMMAHIGDSRIYHIRPEMGILYRSSDHSYVNSLVHNGVISPEEAVNHPQSNIIERCMEPVEDDQSRCMATVMQTKDIMAGDYFFLCSDGVLHDLTDDHLVTIISNPEMTDKDKINKIASISRDSSDNNTAWLIHVRDVVVDEKEEIDTVDIDNDGSITRQIPFKKYHQEEVESVPSNNNRTIWGWIKNIFK
ncbi:MAG: serine/threonine-protein phosphatase [Prevotella sp.]|nr:serine/threonine-protein phosphatase [Prevotella sp.]